MAASADAITPLLGAGCAVCLIGPLVGGLPYIWLVISLPFMYVIGLMPALIAGLLYAAWWVAPDIRRPTRLWRAAVGAICGAAGCAAVAAGYSPGSSGLPFLVLAAHGVPAAIILALATGAEKSKLAAGSAPPPTAARTQE